MRKKTDADRLLTSRTIGKEIAQGLQTDALKILEDMNLIPSIRAHNSMLADKLMVRRSLAKEGIFNGYYRTVQVLLDIGTLKT